MAFRRTVELPEDLLTDVLAILFSDIMDLLIAAVISIFPSRFDTKHCNFTTPFGGQLFSPGEPSSDRCRILLGGAFRLSSGLLD
jgi:hypothetical protein